MTIANYLLVLIEYGINVIVLATITKMFANNLRNQTAARTNLIEGFQAVYTYWLVPT